MPSLEISETVTSEPQIVASRHYPFSSGGLEVDLARGL